LDLEVRCTYSWCPVELGTGLQNPAMLNGGSEIARL
jgi:hypothetical protein